MNQQRQFKQLCIEERGEIKEMLHDGYSLRAIGERLGRSHTSISRELKKHRSGVRRSYTPRIAQEKVSVIRKKRGARARLKSQLVRDYVEEKLHLKWSPEQIAGRLPRDHPGHTISHEAIYLYIYARCERDGYGTKVRGEDLRKYLRRRRKYRNRKNVPYPGDVGNIRGRRSIEMRPKYIEKRKQLGHWESDSIVSSASPPALNSMVERSCGYLKLKKVADGSAAETAKAIISQLSPFPSKARRTITSDNGKEHAEHVRTSAALDVQWFFCHAYSSHERGTNENTNGLVRDYFPKKTDFASVTDERIQEVEDLLNDRPRKRLKYKTPREVFNSRGALTG